MCIRDRGKIYGITEKGREIAEMILAYRRRRDNKYREFLLRYSVP